MLCFEQRRALSVPIFCFVCILVQGEYEDSDPLSSIATRIPAGGYVRGSTKYINGRDNMVVSNLIMYQIDDMDLKKTKREKESTVAMPLVRNRVVPILTTTQKWWFDSTHGFYFTPSFQLNYNTSEIPRSDSGVLCVLDTTNSGRKRSRTNISRYE